MTATLRLVIADDHPVFLAGLEAALESDSGLQIVAVASDGREVLEVVAREQPDVVVMDLHMPELNGVEATRAIMESGSAAKVLVLTMFDEDESIFAAMRAGAGGYVLKGAGQEEIIRAIRAVGAGEMLFGAPVAQRMLEFFSDRTTQPPVAFPDLTDREREILQLVAGGAANAEISRTLFLSEKTVRNNITNIFRKLDVTDRAHAIVKAREAGLGGS